MRNFIEKFREFMFGRYGYDKLGMCLVVIYLLINGISSVVFRNIFWGRIICLIIACAILGYAVVRFLSKNIYKREQEELKFENFVYSLRLQDRINLIKEKNKRIKLKWQFRKTHRFRTCPNCGENLRISKRRGKREITCPKCGCHFKTRVIL